MNRAFTLFQKEIISRAIFWSLFFLLFSTSSFSEILNLDRALSDTSYRESIRARFQAIRTIEIAGSNLRGNKTVKKKNGKIIQPETLDPSIMIINPAFVDHDAENDEILGIHEDALNMEVFKKIFALCEEFEHHRFEKIYLNNFWWILPIPRGLPSKFQNYEKWYNNGSKSSEWFNDVPLVQAAFYNYVEEIQNNPSGFGSTDQFGLYSIIQKLLKDDGDFLFKTGSVEIFPTFALLSIFDLENGFGRAKFQCTLEACEKRIKGIECPDHDQHGMYTKAPDDHNLIDTIETSVRTEPGKVIKLAKSPLKLGENGKLAPIQKTISRRMLFEQIRLLELSGFHSIDVGFGYLNSWGWVESEYAYSMIIGAKKKKA